MLVFKLRLRFSLVALFGSTVQTNNEREMIIGLLIVSLHCSESSPAARTFIPHGHRNPSQNKPAHGLCDSSSATGIRLTCLLLLLSFIFVLCTMPISIRLLVADFLPGHRSTSRWQIVHLILNLLMYLNHAVSAPWVIDHLLPCSFV